MKLKLRLTPLGWIALMLLLVGIGNVCIGRAKRAEYQSALAQEGTSVTPPHSDPLQQKGLHKGQTSRPPTERRVDLDSLYSRRVISRIDYYTVVYRGGLILIAIAGCVGILGMTPWGRRR